MRRPMLYGMWTLVLAWMLVASPRAIGQQAVTQDPPGTGEVAAYTGPKAPDESGDAQGKFCTAQGNTLGRLDTFGPPDANGRRTRTWPPADGFHPSFVPAAMVKGFESSEMGANGRRNHISQRLVAALEAGQAAGGDNRGMESAALIVVKKDAGVWLHNDVVLHLQVDDNPEPIRELRRLVEMSPAARRGGREPQR
jgi:uncharacterized Ntn-hydrolase superfamily protein